MPKGYSLAQIRLHWVITGLITVQCLFGGIMTEDWETWRLHPATRITGMEFIHVTLGLLIFALTLWRLALRIIRGAPPLPEADNPVLSLLARGSHAALFGVCLAMPLTGAIAWFADSEAMATVHRVVQVLLYMIVGLHVAAAMFHQFLLRDGLLGRMLNPED